MISLFRFVSGPEPALTLGQLKLISRPSKAARSADARTTVHTPPWIMPRYYWPQRRQHSPPLSAPHPSQPTPPHGAHTTIFDLIRRLKALNRFWHASRPAGSQRALRLLQDVAAPAQDDRMRRMAEVSRRWATFCRPFDYLKKKKSLSQKKKFNL